MNDSQIVKLIQNLISTTVEKIIDKTLRGKYLVCRKAVIVKNYNTTTNRATVFIPTDPNIESNYAYYNKTGRKLVGGQKVYLVYQLNSISQGWLENMYPSEIEELNTNQLIVGGKNLNTSQSQTMDDMVANFGFQYSAKTGAPTNGAFISFNGLNDKYVFQMTCSYINSNSFYFRTKNGDSNTWNSWRTIPIITDTSYCQMSGKHGYFGIDEATGNYLRVPKLGLLPNASSTGGSIGASGWRFTNGYFSNHISVEYENTNYGISTNSLISQSWIRTTGATGWFNETYSGGIYMTNNVSVVVYNNKQFVVNNVCNATSYWITNVPLRTAGFAISGGNRNTDNNSISEITLVKSSSPYLQMITPRGEGTTAWGVGVWASDIKMKKNIKEIPINKETKKSRSNLYGTYIDALSIINSIKHYSFDWNDLDGHINLGYIADYLQEIYPDAVFEVGDEETGKTKNISVSAIIPLITLATQQQNVIIANQSKKIEDLETRITNLEKLSINN